MNRIESALNTRSADFLANREHNLRLVETLRQTAARAGLRRRRGQGGIDGGRHGRDQMQGATGRAYTATCSMSART